MGIHKVKWNAIYNMYLNKKQNLSQIDDILFLRDIPSHFIWHFLEMRLRKREVRIGGRRGEGGG
jgi:hypothetical protein